MINKRKNDDFQKALNYAGKILSKRMHSCVELRIKLSKKFTPETVNRAINELSRLSFLDDSKFAQAYADELKSKGFGKNLIHAKLRKRGLDPEVISQSFAIDDIEEKRIAREFILAKLHKFKREPDARKKKMKILRILLNRGFSLDIAQELAYEILDSTKFS
ncbi:MAG TPA: regulatory protein RecX [Victivallales bacterium]|nr:regulatory protein RecX [Victivallales bacterium]HRU01526.1 regulatory protein RecX [Victivallales bacterium]